MLLIKIGLILQKIIFSPKEGGCPEGQYWTGTECKIIPKNTKIVYSEEELAKLNISPKKIESVRKNYAKLKNILASINSEEYAKFNKRSK